MADMLAIWSPQPNWMPRKPKLMFQICQKESWGFVERAVAVLMECRDWGFAKRRADRVTRRGRPESGMVSGLARGDAILLFGQSGLYSRGNGDSFLGSLMSILMPILVTLHVIVCILMVLVVLMQRPRSEGLGSAFGGGITDNVFGSQTTNVLARFTTWMAIGFFAITLLLSIITAKASSGKTEIQKKLLSAPVPEATATPAPEATPEATPAATPESAATPAAAPESAASPAESPAVEEAQTISPEPAVESATSEATSQGVESATTEAVTEPAPVEETAEPVQN